MQTLKTYELVLLGWRGDTDETDHLIKWVVASSPEIAAHYAKGQGWTLQREPEMIYVHAMTLEEGADAVLY